MKYSSARSDYAYVLSDVDSCKQHPRLDLDLGVSKSIEFITGRCKQDIQRSSTPAAAEIKQQKSERSAGAFVSDRSLSLTHGDTHKRTRQSQLGRRGLDEDDVIAPCKARGRARGRERGGSGG
jgi:hypothetical protein